MFGYQLSIWLEQITNPVSTITLMHKTEPGSVGRAATGVRQERTWDRSGQSTGYKVAVIGHAKLHVYRTVIRYKLPTVQTKQRTNLKSSTLTPHSNQGAISPSAFTMKERGRKVNIYIVSMNTTLASKIKGLITYYFYHATPKQV